MTERQLDLLAFLTYGWLLGVATVTLLDKLVEYLYAQGILP